MDERKYVPSITDRTLERELLFAKFSIHPAWKDRM